MAFAHRLQKWSETLYLYVRNYKTRLRYMILFSLAPIFGSFKQTLDAGSETLFGLDGIFVMGLAYALGMFFTFFFFKQERLHKAAKFWASLCLVSYVYISIFHIGVLTAVFMLLFGLSLGTCSSIALFGFTFALDKRERFLGAGLTIVYALVFRLLAEIPALSSIGGKIYLASQVLFTFLCLIGYKPADYEEKLSNSLPRDNKLLFAAGYFFFAYKIITHFFSALFRLGQGPFYGVFSLLLLILALLVYFMLKFNVVHLCNLFFIGMILAYVLRLAEIYTGKVFAPSNLLQSFSYVGFITSYYLLGTSLAQGVSFKQFKFVLFGIQIVNLLVQMLPRQLRFHHPTTAPFIALGVSASFLFVFMLLMPSLVAHLSPKVEETKSEETQASEKQKRQALMESLALSQRESEIAEMLYSGLLFKECAQALDISLDTVRFHSKNIYKKLGISGRSALALFFDEHVG